MKILFICESNVGRSQMAEAFYNHISGRKDASSAGVKALIRKYHGRPAKEVTKIMSEIGIDISQQRVKQLTKQMVDKAEKVFVLCHTSFCPEYLLTSKKATFIEINDPYQKSINTMRTIRDHIRKIVTEELVTSNVSNSSFNE